MKVGPINWGHWGSCTHVNLWQNSDQNGPILSLYSCKSNYICMSITRYILSNKSWLNEHIFQAGWVLFFFFTKPILNEFINKRVEDCLCKKIVNTELNQHEIYLLINNTTFSITLSTFFISHVIRKHIYILYTILQQLILKLKKTKQYNFHL